jgi:hypothetical protein
MILKKNKEENGKKVIKFGYKEIFKDRFKEAIAIIITAFLWLLRISFIPSMLIVFATWFSMNMIPIMAIEIFKYSHLSVDSPLTDQFAFFYLPMMSFVFIFGVVIVLLVCYTEYRFWKKCGSWIKIWYARTNIENPFKIFKNEVKN